VRFLPLFSRFPLDTDSTTSTASSSSEDASSTVEEQGSLSLSPRLEKVLTLSLLLVISKLITLVTSVFTAAYVALWPRYFPNSPLDLDHLPVFDGRFVLFSVFSPLRCRLTFPSVFPLRVVQYTSETEIRDYMRWRQVDSTSLPSLSAQIQYAHLLLLPCPRSLAPSAPYSSHQQHVQQLFLGSRHPRRTNRTRSEQRA
jgi:hypothetical protein